VSAAIIISIVSVCAVITSVIIMYLQHRDSHKDSAGREFDTKVKRVVEEENKILKAVQESHTVRFAQDGDRLNRIEDLLRDMASNQREFSDQMAKMGVKVDMYWNSLEQLAMNTAKNLHQPDPARQHIDLLLEAFMEGTITDAEKLELKKILVKIRNYDPAGPPLNFPVHPGEQTAAAILLSTMDIVDPRRMAAMGHAEHRSAEHKGDNA
jgi:hypothetical protein